MNDKLGAGKAQPSAETLLTHGGRDPNDQFGFVNTPVFRGSTVPTVQNRLRVVK